MIFIQTNMPSGQRGLPIAVECTCILVGSLSNNKIAHYPFKCIYERTYRNSAVEWVDSKWQQSHSWFAWSPIRLASVRKLLTKWATGNSLRGSEMGLAGSVVTDSLTSWSISLIVGLSLSSDDPNFWSRFWQRYWLHNSRPMRSHTIQRPSGHSDDIWVLMQNAHATCRHGKSYNGYEKDRHCWFWIRKIPPERSTRWKVLFQVFVNSVSIYITLFRLLVVLVFLYL